MQTVISLEHAGHQIINNVRVPVYKLDSGRYVQQKDDATGMPLLLSVEAAKQQKNGAYPLHPDLQHVIESTVVNDEVPLALRSDESQSESAQTLLRALLGRMIDVKAPLSISEN